MHKTLLLMIFLSLFTGVVSAQENQPQPQPTPRGSVVTVDYPAADAEKRLIGFSWRSPNLNVLPDYIDALQSSPFDGFVFNFETTLDRRGAAFSVFVNTPLDQAAMDALAAQYVGFNWGRLTDNFLRVNLVPAELDWFDDYSVILSNLEAMAQLAFQLGFRGIMLDTEMYGENTLLDFGLRPNNDRYDYPAYVAQVYQRGQAIIQALNRGYPGLTVMMTFGPSHVLNSGNPYTLHYHPYGLIVPLVDGMLAGADANTVFVDGYEGSYTFTMEVQFTDAYTIIKNLMPDAYSSQPQLYRQRLQVGFGLFLDHRCEGEPMTADGCPQGFTPGIFQQSLTFALRYSDRYVWVYSQNGIDWLNPDTIPAEWRVVFDSFR